MNKGMSTPGGVFSNTNSFQTGQRQNYRNNNPNNSTKFTNNNNTYKNGNTNLRNNQKSRTKYNKPSNSNNGSSNGLKNSQNLKNNLNRNQKTMENTNYTGSNINDYHKSISRKQQNSTKKTTKSENSFINPNVNFGNPIPDDQARSMDPNGFEAKYFGSLISTPEQFGFKKLAHRPQKTPKYLLKENVLFSMDSYQRNEWDYQNQQMLLKREAEFSGEPQLLFEEFQQHRKTEREMMEKFNLVDKENAKKSLDDAIIFRGSCEDMCPTYERVERVFKNQVSKWEKDPNTGRISRNYALKTFIRPSGQAPPLPSDVRPPNILQNTLNHIIENLLPQLPESQSFIWDRTRSIRQDFTFQNNYSGIESIDCHEKICRIHILSLHVMAGANDPDYQQQQEVEQFNNSLQTLTHMYDDVRSRGGYCPNEPEFRAYELISKMKDAEIERYLQTLPTYIQDDPIVKRAVMLRTMIVPRSTTLSLYSEFFSLVLNKYKTPYLLAALAEIHFNEIRYNGLKSYSKIYHSKSKSFPSVEELTRVFGYNDEEQLLETCRLYTLPIIVGADGDANRVDVSALKSSFKASQKQPCTRAIDSMIDGIPFSDVINSGKPNDNLRLKQPPTVEQIARESFRGSKRNTNIVQSILNNDRGTTPKFSNVIEHSGSIPNSYNASNFTSSSASAGILDGTLTDNQQKGIDSGLAFTSSIDKKDDRAFNFSNTFGTSNEKASINAYAGPTLLKGSSGLSGNREPNTLSEIKPESPSNFKNPVAFSGDQKDTSKPQPFVISTCHSESKNLDFAEKEPGSGANSNSAIPLPSPPKQLVEDPQFKTQALKWVNKMLDGCVNKLSKEIISNQIQTEQEKRRRAQSKKHLISKLSNELFTAFMEEQMYLAGLQSKADSFRARHLKTSVITKLLSTSKLILEKKRIRDAKSKEIAMFNSVSSINLPEFPFPAIKKVKPSESNFLTVVNDVTSSFNRVKATGNMGVSIVLRSPESLESQWLTTRLGLKPNEQRKVFFDDFNHKLAISVLPDNLKPKEYFKTINSVIIQVGTVETTDNRKTSTLVKCLQKDSKVLTKLHEYWKKYSTESPLSMTIVYVDSFNVGLPYEKVKQLLQLEKISSFGVTIGFFKLNRSNIDSGSALHVVKKVNNNFSKILETVWLKMYLRKGNIIPSDGNSINELSKTNLTSVSTDAITNDSIDSTSSNSSVMRKPNLLSKRRLEYIHKSIGDAQVKRMKYENRDLGSRNMSSLMDRSINISVLRSNSNSTLNSEMGQSFMHLRNYSSVNNDTTIRNEKSIFSVEKERKRLAALKELEELADSVLKD